MNELPSGHLNFSPDKVLPNEDDLQVPACADGINKKNELSINKKVDTKILNLICKRYL